MCFLVRRPSVIFFIFANYDPPQWSSSTSKIIIIDERSSFQIPKRSSRIHDPLLCGSSLQYPRHLRSHRSHEKCRFSKPKIVAKEANCFMIVLLWVAIFYQTTHIVDCPKDVDGSAINLLNYGVQEVFQVTLFGHFFQIKVVLKQWKEKANNGIIHQEVEEQGVSYDPIVNVVVVQVQTKTPSSCLGHDSSGGHFSLRAPFHLGIGQL